MESLSEIITSQVDRRRREIAAKRTADNVAAVEAINALAELTQAVRGAGLARVIATLGDHNGDIPIARAIENRVETRLILRQDPLHDLNKCQILCKVRFTGAGWASPFEGLMSLGDVIRRYCTTTPKLADEILALA